MTNKSHAVEWMEKAYHDLDAARILYVAGHFTDTIGYILHQSIEKVLKSYLAYNNIPILKTHNLIELNELLCLDLNEDDVRFLAIATTYYIKQRYPSPHKKLPSKEEIKNVMELAESLFETRCNQLNIERHAFQNV